MVLRGPGKGVTMWQWINALMNWYTNWRIRHKLQSDPLLALRGTGKHLWADEHADEYVQRLREK
jgi:hypothetical protein